jgi:hypothetical protein
MTRTRSGQRTALVLFLSIIFLGVILITIAYRQSEWDSPQEPASEEVTERFKQLISAQSEMSKWLLGLASGALAGLIGLRLKDPSNEHLSEKVPMAAYAFLVLSLYGAFLSYQATLHVLRLGPLTYAYADQFKLPVLVQFWSLIFAAVLLGIWLFGPKKAPAIVLFLIAACVPGAKAQAFDANSCVLGWYKDRLHEPNASTKSAMDVMHRIQKKPEARPFKSCGDLESVLDQLRFSAVQSGKQDTPVSFNSYLAGLQDELDHPGLSTSGIVHSIIELMSPWDEPLAVLSVRASDGTYQILLNATEVGLTNWTRRVKPGTYRVRVVRNFKVAYSSDSVTLAADESKVIDLDRVKP